MVWVEDHAEQLILITLGILIVIIVTLLLWKTARVISLAMEFGPVLGVIAGLTTISFAALNLLKGRRDRRRMPPEPPGEDPLPPKSAIEDLLSPEEPVIEDLLPPELPREDPDVA